MPLSFVTASVVGRRREGGGDLLGEAAVGGRRRRPLVGHQGDLVLGAAGDVVLLRHLLRRLAHRHPGRVLGDRRGDRRQIGGPELAQDPHPLGHALRLVELHEDPRRLLRELDGDVRQRLGAPGEDDAHLAGEDGLGTEGDGAVRGGAGEVDGRPRDVHGERGAEDHLPPEVGGVEGGDDAAEDRHLDDRGVDPRPGHQLGRGGARQVDDVHVLEVRPRLDERRPAAVDDRHPAARPADLAARRRLGLRLAARASPHRVGALGDLL